MTGLTAVVFLHKASNLLFSACFNLHCSRARSRWTCTYQILDESNINRNNFNVLRLEVAFFCFLFFYERRRHVSPNTITAVSQFRGCILSPSPLFFLYSVIINISLYKNMRNTISKNRILRRKLVHLIQIKKRILRPRRYSSVLSVFQNTVFFHS